MTQRHYDERAWWDDIPKAIDAVKRGMPVDFNQALKRYLVIPDAAGAMTALDACCGVGQGSIILHEKGYKVTAFDRHAPAADILKHYPIDFVATDFFLADFPKQSFDLVVCSDALEHLPLPKSAFSHLKTWVKPEGRIYLAVPIEGKTSPNPYHLNAWTREGFLAMLDGWTVETNFAPKGAPVLWLLLKRRDDNAV